MSASGPERVERAWPLAERSYDPLVNPEYFKGVPGRRALAFLLDLAILTVPVIVVSFLILVFGLLTLGLGWALFWLLSPAAVVWGLSYYGMTLGGPASATLGMRAVALETRGPAGGPVSVLLAVAHPTLYWISVSALTPLVLLLIFFNAPRRLLHDFLLGTVVVNTEARADALRRSLWSRR